MGGFRSHSGKINKLENLPKIVFVLIFFDIIPCVLCLYTYTLLKVVRQYDLSALSMSVMGFQR